MAELVVVVAIVSVLTAIMVPFFLSFWRTSGLKAGAEELATVLNRARQVAIQNNTSVCVTNDGTRVQYRQGTCVGAVWTGPGTDAAGFIRLANNMTVTSAQNIVFSYLGTATTPGTYTVSNPQGGGTLSVTVALSGRVSIGP